MSGTKAWIMDLEEEFWDKVVDIIKNLKQFMKPLESQWNFAKRWCLS